MEMLEGEPLVAKEIAGALITGGAVGYILNDKEFQNSGWAAYYWVMIWWTVLVTLPCRCLYPSPS